MDRILDNSTDLGVLLSIITVTHNDAERLSRTIQSLFNFYGDDRYEHIVVDGGSIDRTSDVVDSLTHVSNFRFDSGLDEGIYDAMNLGTQRSCGRFMLFLNCGDCMLASPNDIANWLHDIDHKSVDILCFPFAHGDSTFFKIVELEKVKSYKLPTSHQGMVFLSDFVRTYRYDTRYQIAADYDLYLHAKLSRIIRVPVAGPLTAVEVDGVASSNPITSYKEYLLISFRNLQGFEMIMSLLFIGCRAMLVIPMKFLLPQSLIKKYR